MWRVPGWVSGPGWVVEPRQGLLMGWSGSRSRVSQDDLSLPLQNGKHDEAWMVLKQVHDTNMRAKGHPERVFSVRTPQG